MTSVTKIFIFTIVFALHSVSWAGDYRVNILKKSSTGRTLVLDIGMLEGVAYNDLGMLLGLKEYPLKNLRSSNEVRPLVKLRAIKTFDNYSLWIITHTYETIDDIEKLLLLTSKDLLRGKAPLTSKNVKIISEEKHSKEFLRQQLSENNEHLNIKRDDYFEERALHKYADFYDRDIELLDVETPEKHSKSIFRSQYKEDFMESKNVQVFNKMIYNFIKKYSDFSYDRDLMYKEQKRYAFNDEFKDRSLNEAYKDEVLYNKQRYRMAFERMRQEIEEEGPVWSKKYSDEELSKRIKAAGISNEILRQEENILSMYDKEVTISFSYNLLDNNNDLDPVDKEQSPYSVGIEFEWAAFKIIDSSYKSFTLKTGLRNSRDSFITYFENAKINEYSGDFFLNFYPIGNFALASKNSFYVGVGGRFGYGTLEVPSLGEKGDYMLTSFPSITAGYKYTFLSSFGVKLFLNYDKINLRRQDTTDPSLIALEDNMYFYEGKLGFGITKLF